MDLDRYTVLIIKYFLFFLISAFNTCNYSKYQKIPVSVDIISTSTYSTGSPYLVIFHELDNSEDITINDWQNGLICKGYSNRPEMLAWIKYSLLSNNDKESLNYFFELMIESIDESLFTLQESVDNYYISGCFTEVYAEFMQQLYKTYHVVYFLSSDKSFFYEIRLID